MKDIIGVVVAVIITVVIIIVLLLFKKRKISANAVVKHDKTRYVIR